ncbi:hypothetical protein D9M71_416910 [compost metagenome]
MAVGQPLPRLARVVEIEHRGHGVDAQAIEVELRQPPMRRRQQEAAHLVAAVVEDVRAPVGVQAQTRVLVLVQCGAVETGQRPVVLRKMPGHPVEQHAQTGRVAGVDEGAQLVRRAVARGRRKVAGGLVAPGLVERVLGDRQQLDMGVALGHRVGNQPLGQLAPQVGPAIGMAHPRAGMHLVDIQRRVLPVPAGPLLQPLRIAPAVLRGRDHVGR